jgi:hypothetical protein
MKQTGFRSHLFPSRFSAIATAELNFVQISDSHIGFNKPANTDVVGTGRETIMRINALPKVPEFLRIWNLAILNSEEECAGIIPGQILYNTIRK